MLEIEKKLTRKYQDNLTDNEVEYMYLAKYKVKFCNFYSLRKTHKCKGIQENAQNIETFVDQLILNWCLT